MEGRISTYRYEQIAAVLREAILRGEYAALSRLPSERRLMETYGVQRNTVRQALGVLEREGVIESVGKSGWYVAAGASSAARIEPITQNKRVLLVTFSHKASPAVDTLVSGLRETLATQGVQLLRYYSSDHEEWGQHIDSLDELLAVKAGGVVMWPHSPLDARLLTRLKDAMPLVLVDRRVFGFESDSVRFDDLGGAKAVTKHLIDQGHRRIAFLADEPFAETVQARWRGYSQALEAAGIPIDDNLTVFAHGPAEPTFTNSARFALRGLSDPPTAFVCSNDSVGTRLMLILREEGLRVPEDIAVTGFGNESPGYLDVMGLTSVSQSFIEVGHAAGELLLERMAESPETRGGPSREILLPMRLVLRSSSGAAPTEDPVPAGR